MDVQTNRHVYMISVSALCCCFGMNRQVMAYVCTDRRAVYSQQPLTEKDDRVMCFDHILMLFFSSSLECLMCFSVPGMLHASVFENDA